MCYSCWVPISFCPRHFSLFLCHVTLRYFFPHARSRFSFSQFCGFQFCHSRPIFFVRHLRSGGQDFYFHSASLRNSSGDLSCPARREQSQTLKRDADIFFGLAPLSRPHRPGTHSRPFHLEITKDKTPTFHNRDDFNPPSRKRRFSKHN